MTTFAIDQVDFSGWSIESTPLVQELVDRIQLANIRCLNLPKVVTINFLRNDDSKSIADVYEEGVIVLNTSIANCMSRNCDIDEKLLVISHELVHLEQLHTGRMKFDPIGNRISWRGNWFDLNVRPMKVKYKSVEDEQAAEYKRYLSLPWEKEAHARQELVYKEVFNLSL